jgi:hypothetical protein
LRLPGLQDGQQRQPRPFFVAHSETPFLQGGFSVLKLDAKFASSICRSAATAEQTDKPTAGIIRNSVSAGFPKRSAIFEQALPKHQQGHESCQHQRCDHHLNNRETGRVLAKKPACNNSANP